jgi:hypothetical protein
VTALVIVSALVMSAVALAMNWGHGDRIDRTLITACGAVTGVFMGFMLHTTFGWANDANETCLRTYTQATCTELMR